MESSEDPRNRLAGERTLLAWIRTALALMGLGFVVARFGLFLRELARVEHAPVHASSGLSLWIGIALVLLGVIVSLVTAAQHAEFVRRLDRGEPYRPPAFSLGLWLAVVLGILGIGVMLYLLILRT